MKTRKTLCKYGLHKLIPCDKWLFVRDRRDKARVMQERDITLLIDDRHDTIAHVRDTGKQGVRFTSWDQTMRDISTWQVVRNRLKLKQPPV